MRKPDFFIVGAPKCGTTAMYTYLKKHPDVYMPDKLKEPHYFGKDLHFNRPGVRIETLAEYLQLFSGSGDKQRVGEASPAYLMSKSAASEIKEFNSKAQIIIMLRNPVEALYSLHSECLYSGNEDIQDFEEALNAEQERKNGARIPPSAVFAVEILYYRDVVRYADQVKRYLDVFGKEAIHIIIYDDFKNDTKKAYKQTLSFLGVDEEFLPEIKVVNPNKTISSAPLDRLLKNTPKAITRLGRFVMPFAARQNIRNLLARLNTKYTAREPLNATLKSRLQSEFASDIEQLSALLGRDLTHWSRS